MDRGDGLQKIESKQEIKKDPWSIDTHFWLNERSADTTIAVIIEHC